MADESLRQRLGSVEVAPLRLRARSLAEGLFGGLHRATRKGPGIEFAGHRPYSPGDDLRHLDRHALLRHGRHLIREFHTETERAVTVLVDASPSMFYRSELDRQHTREGLALSKKGQSHASKLEHAALLAAALSYVAYKAGDPTGLCVVGAQSTQLIPPRTGGEHLERILATLEETESWAARPAPTGDSLSKVERNMGEALDQLGARLPRGSQVFVLSDFLGLSATLRRALASLGTRRRRVTALQILDPAELHFPFDGPVRLRDTESSHELETDAGAVRQEYLDALAKEQSILRQELQSAGGTLLTGSTDEDPGQFLLRSLTVQ